MHNIIFNKKKFMFYFNTKNVTCIFGINSEKKLFNVYYGKRMTIKKLKNIKEPCFNEIGYHSSNNLKSNFQPEINIYDGYNVFENTIKCSFSDGDRIIDYEYIGYEIKDNLLNIKLKDKKYNFFITLNYRIYYENDIIEKSIYFENKEKNISVTLETFNSGDLVLPAGKYYLGYFYGGWIKEMGLRIEEISYGKKVLESRTGNSSHIHNPSFFISKKEKPSEDTGEIYFGQLLWSGNWKFVFEKRFYDVVSFTGGINNFDGFITLKPGNNFLTPSLILGYSDKGLGQMSRNLHNFYRDFILPKENLKKPKPVLVNSWEAFYFDINEEKILKLADIAKEIGAELLVIDDGWFKGRNDDSSSLGDWIEDKNKFPDGLKNLRNKIKEKGLMFGIWIEPEMVSPDSDLYRKHPDWCYYFKDRKKIEMRHQLVLNITRDDVKEYVKGVIKRIITEYNPDYIKWDMNRYISQPGAFNLSDIPVWVEHIKIVYELMEYTRKLKPDLILEGCAGGGGRLNGGILKYVDQMWVSDNNDPFCRQFIQYGVSLFYPAAVMCCHIGDSPYALTGRKSRLLFRIHTAMAGNFGIEANLLKWTQKEIEILKREIKRYKEIREIIYNGDLYRIESPYNSDRVSFLYVSKDKCKAVLFVYIMNNSKKLSDLLRLKGLKEDFRYYMEIKNRKICTTGYKLMTNGIKLSENKKQDTYIIRLIKI